MKNVAVSIIYLCVCFLEEHSPDFVCGRIGEDRSIFTAWKLVVCLYDRLFSIDVNFNAIVSGWIRCKQEHLLDIFRVLFLQRGYGRHEVGVTLIFLPRSICVVGDPRSFKNLVNEGVQQFVRPHILVFGRRVVVIMIDSFSPKQAFELDYKRKFFFCWDPPWSEILVCLGILLSKFCYFVEVENTLVLIA